MKKRLDAHLHEAGYFDSRTRAQAAVMEGLVSVDGRTDVKPGTQVTGAEDIKVADKACPFVSRGGTKLAGALEDLGLGVSGRAALDVGKGQLHARLREDARVAVLEGVNARDIEKVVLPRRPDLAVIDVSFISLKKVLEPVWRVLAADGVMLALVKPQFEAGVGKAPKGVVRDHAVHLEVLNGLAAWLSEKGFSLRGLAPSRLKGPKGNVEFFMLIERGTDKRASPADIAEAVRRADAI